MEELQLYSEIMLQRGKLAANLISKYPAYTTLLDGGLIQEKGIIQSVICDQCETPHDAEIVFEGSQYGYFCPDLGFIPKDRSKLIAITANIDKFVSDLADYLEVKRRKTTPIAGDIWRVGVLSSYKSDLVIYFRPTLRDFEDLEACKAALGREVKASYGIILTALGALELPPYKTVKLTEALSFDAASGTFILDFDLFEIAGVPVRHKGGRPSLYANALSALIEQREKDGIALSGRNEEAKAVFAEFSVRFPNNPPPSLSTVKRYISEFRSGS